MSNIQVPTFTEADIYVIENTDRAVLKASIEFLKTYTKVMWKYNDPREIVLDGESEKRKLITPPFPQYPEDLVVMGEMFSHMMWDKKEFRINLRESGFFTKNSLASCYLGTMFSASLIASFICDAFTRERFCDGLFGFGVQNGLYLKMLLRLDDLIQYYDYTKETSASILL